VQQPQAAAPNRAAAGSSPGPSEASSATGAAVYSPRFDFVPGENVLFFEDFSTTDPGDFPAKWALGGLKGQLEVVDYQGKRWLTLIKPITGNKMIEGGALLRVDFKKKLPPKFTIEFDMPATAYVNLVITDKYWFTGQDYVLMGPTFVQTRHANVKDLPSPTNALRHVSIAVSGTNIKVYYDGERVLLDPEGLPSGSPDSKTLPATVGINLRVDGMKDGIGYSSEGPVRDDLMFTNFKLAEGGKDYAKDLAVSGRIVTHGITFDSGSDVLRPESGPTLRKILKLLQDEPSLAFEIQGHTDSQGSDKVNGPLSQARAAAVKAWLVSQGIEPGKLTTKGLGASKPLQSNDTPEGRADNRRVEFVKTS
jgi:OOP family OmpA-OmpF porin